MIGIQATATQVNNQIGQLALALRDACQDAANFQEWIVAQTTAGLTAMGFNANDAAAVQQMASYLNTVAALFFGTAAQPTDFNFNNALSQLYGGT